MPLDVDSLLLPIAADAPVGPDLRAEAGLGSVYFKLKDARAQARMAERTAESGGEPVGVPAEWQVVRDLALDVLGRRSKDLEVAGWLLEAMVRTEGFSGFSSSTLLIDGLVERYWPALHSVDTSDDAGRVSPLAGLNGVGGEGALIQPLRMVPLLPGSSYGHNALWHMGRIAKDPNGSLARAFSDARAAAGTAALRARAMEAGAAREAFSRLTGRLDTLCGADAPPSSNIRNVLDEVVDAYRALIGDAPVPPEAAPVPEAAAVAEDSPLQPAAALREIATREQAFTELLRIADFFRRHEPHSPISYALETLVARGRMSFIDLLQELLPDPGQRKQVLQHAGIHPQADGPRT